MSELRSIAERRQAFRVEQQASKRQLQRELRRVEQAEELNAFITPPDGSVFDEVSPSHNGRPLGGISVAVKDNICTAGMRTTAASRMLKDFHPLEDAEVVRRLQTAGAVIFGKTNLDEFAMGNSTETSYFGPTRHPDDATRVPGGSSGGSAAAVAAGCCAASLGSDTGGSVRQPASFCGVVGFKPTWGRVSRRGLIAFASSLDQIGWLTPTVDGAARLFEVLAGADAGDATSRREPSPPVDREHAPSTPLDALRIGVPWTWLEDCDIDSDVDIGFERLCRRLEDSGATIVGVELPHASAASPTYQVIATAEASSNLARYDGVRYGRRAEAEDFDELVTKSRSEGFGREVKRRILLGAFTLSEGYYDAHFERACKVRRLIIDDFRRALEDVDVLCTPTTPTTAFLAGQRGDDPLDTYADDLFTVPVSLAGLPAISIPAGRSRDGLPYGVQLVAPAFEEPRLFSSARTIESVTGGLM